MLCSFTLGNFRSFRDETTLNLQASTQRIPFVPEKTAGFDKLRLLPAAVIYGPNASGKTNVIKAAMVLREVVLSGLDKAFPLAFLPFIHDSDDTRPMLFEMDFITNGHRFVYHLEIGLSECFIHNCKVMVLLESLAQDAEKLFVRTADSIQIMRTKKALAIMGQTTGEKLDYLEASVNENMTADALFLTGGFQSTLCKAIATEVIAFFEEKMIVSTGDLAFKITDFNKAALRLFNLVKDFADIGPQRILLEPIRRQDEKTEGYEFFSEYVLGMEGKIVRTPANWMESEGTMHLIALSCLLFGAMQNGSVLFIDELDASIHPELTAGLIAAFNDPELNPNQAQLIFTTHNPAYLNKDLLRRDQILFTEKKGGYASELYSLADFGSEIVRGDGSYLKQYFKGSFGALPLHSFADVLRAAQDIKTEVNEDR